MSEALLTDLYQLTMLQTYLERGLTERASFEFFVRRLPRSRNFLLACGLEQALGYLEELRFSEWDLDFIGKTGRFSRDFQDRLAELRFTGDVDAMAEGTVFFAGEPILRVSAPLPEAQLVETRLINLLQLEIVIASKAARVVLAAPGKLLVDFGLRRAHGGEAGLLAARASWIAGFSGTSNVLAGARFGIPLYGTMAHSFIEAHGDEAEAFRAFARSHPGDVVLLLDTYDTEAAAEKVVALAREGIPVKSVRLDSGDLGQHARRVRRILDDGGLSGVRIFASGGLDEREIEELLRAGAPIDGFGVGTRLSVSSDAPALDCAYKLVEYAGRPRYKRSEGKATLPGCKQVYRQDTGDVIALADEVVEKGRPLLWPVMRGGRRLAPLPTPDEIRAHCAHELAALPEPLRRLREPARRPVGISEGLRALCRDLFGLPGVAEDATLH